MTRKIGSYIEDNKEHNVYADICISELGFFSITGEVCTNNTTVCSGCIHDEILKVRPDFKDIIDMHLHYADGSPIHAVENGYYFLHELDIYGKPFPDENICRHFHISKEQIPEIRNMTKQELSDWVDTQRERWNKEATAIIKKYKIRTKK